MNDYRTAFASLQAYDKGSIELIDDDRRRYAFSNVFEVAHDAAPYEKVVVGKNLDYVIEVLRAEGESPWFAASHDEFALVMDGAVRIDLVKLASEQVPPSGQHGSRRIDGAPLGPRMGWLRLERGHQALLPQGAAYRFSATGTPGVVVLQTMRGPLSIERWAEICLT